MFMDGHGAYVWSAYGVALFVLILLLFMPGRRERLLLRAISGEVRRAAIAGAPDATSEHPGRTATGQSGEAGERGERGEMERSPN